MKKQQQKQLQQQQQQQQQQRQYMPRSSRRTRSWRRAATLQVAPWFKSGRAEADLICNLIAHRLSCSSIQRADCCLARPRQREKNGRSPWRSASFQPSHSQAPAQQGLVLLASHLLQHQLTPDCT